MAHESVGKTLLVAGVLCVVCSVLVSTAAVTLKGRQDANKLLDLQKNILTAAGLYSADDEIDIAATFDAKIETRIVDLESGAYVPESEMAAEDFDPAAAAKDPATSQALASGEDPASLKRLEERALVYLFMEEGELQRVILPIRGLGLWGTLYGFLALEQDLETVSGITYYQHKETPGLGGEVDNARWKAQWKGKKLHDASGSVALRVKKGTVNPSIPEEVSHQVDGLAGATITSNGVTKMLGFWLGERGFGPYLKALAEGARN